MGSIFEFVVSVLLNIVEYVFVQMILPVLALVAIGAALWWALGSLRGRDHASGPPRFDRPASPARSRAGSAGYTSRGSYVPPTGRSSAGAAEKTKRRFATQAEAERAVTRSQADFAQGGPRARKYKTQLDHAYEKDGGWYVSSKRKH